MIHASLRMKFALDKVAEASEILCGIVERIRVGQGCLGCDIYQHVQEPGVLLFEQWWNSQADLSRHLRSELSRHVIIVIELAMEYPSIKFSEISHTTGLETVQKSRSGPFPTSEI